MSDGASERGHTDGQPDDRFDLQRFVTAQAGVIEDVLGELAAGRKTSHWMWFVFPQLRGLGSSSMAQFYGIASLDEAKAYLRHPLLGPRLVDCTERVLRHRDHTLHAIFGSPDDSKFRSCMTLFHIASSGPETVFERALGQFCAGERDPRTLALLERESG